MYRILSSVPFLGLLVLPLSAQEEALHGTWEGLLVDEEGNNATMRLTFQPGGAFELDQEITFGEAFQSVVATSEIPVEKVTMEVSGRYQVDGDKLQVDMTEVEMLVDGRDFWTEVEMLVDGRDFWDVLAEVARGLAAVAAGLAGVSEEDYPAFEENFVNEFLAEVSEEEFLAGFSDEVTWSVEGDTLTITVPTEDGGEEVSVYRRVDSMTAVAETTWGGLKAHWRR